MVGFVNEKLFQKTYPGPDSFTSTFGRSDTNYTWTFAKTEMKKTFPSSFCEVSITMTAEKQNKTKQRYRKRKLYTSTTHEHKLKKT
jgi:hypothetical protein